MPLSCKCKTVGSQLCCGRFSHMWPLAVVCTACYTYAQAMRDVRQLTGALQVLSSADEHWAAYLEAAKQELQLALDGT
jgi:hypothetical protein